MKYKSKTQVKHEYPITELLDQHSLDVINELMGTHYTKMVIFGKVRVKRKGYKFSFIDKLMRRRPGLDKED
jgi:hypothetical protein